MEGLLSTGPTQSSCYLLVEMGLPLGKFFHHFWKICYTKSFQWRSLKEGMTLNCIFFVLFALHYYKKRVSQKYLNKKNATFMVLSLWRKISTIIFFWGKNKFSPSPRLNAQVQKSYLGVHCQTVLYSEWILPTHPVIILNSTCLETCRFPEVTKLQFQKWQN